MALSVTATSGSINASLATAHSVQLPATINAGDLIVVFTINVSSTAGITLGGNLTTQYTPLYNADAAGGVGTVQCACFTKIQTTETGGETVAFTTSANTRMACVTLAIAGASGTLTHQVAGAATGEPDPPGSGTHGYSGVMYIGAAHMRGGGATGFTAFPSDLTGGTVQQKTATADNDQHCTMGVAWLIEASASRDPNAFTHENTTDREWYATTVSIEEAGGGGGGTALPLVNAAIYGA